MKIKLNDLQNQHKKGVYFIENLITGQIYIGSVPKATFRKRFKQHKGLIFSYNNKITYKLIPSDIWWNSKKWKLYKFYNHSCPIE